MLKSGKQDQAFYQKFWKTLVGGKVWKGRMINKRKDGTLYTEDSTISPVTDAAGRIVSFVCVKRDITEHLRISEEKDGLEAQFLQAQKMESVGRLAGGVAHDYNNISSIIIGYTEFALEQVKPEDPLHKDLLQILKAANRSTGITRQLLAFARRQTIAPKVLDLNEAIGNLLSMVRRLIGEDIDLAWSPGAKVWPVKIDPSQVDQIIANLSVNARDAIIDVGKVTMETKNICLDEAYCADHAGFVPGEFVLLAISDDGIGIAPDILDKIFEPFFTTKGLGKGTGLGLSTVYGIVKQNNGFINVYSELRKGTTIKIYLPRHRGKVVNSSRDKSIAIPSSRGETILLVEDDDAILKLGKRILEELGYRVLSASSPGEARRIAKEHAGDITLLITDVIMPEMNGRELSENLQSFYPDLKILFMSGYTANVIAHRGVLDEDLFFISKPFSKREMAVKIREVLDDDTGIAC
jgi:signal transduction histidine kinase/CheY-like chemotaxis protein